MLAIALACTAQTKPDTPQRLPDWQQYIEQLSDYDDIESRDIEDMYEQLEELAESPIDLNTANADDLRQLFFLSDQQRDDLAAYIGRYRPLRSVGELSMIRSIDHTRLQLLRCFVRIGAEDRGEHFPTLSNIMKYGKNELMASARIPLYTRAGDRDGYLGSRYRHWARYSFKYGQYVQAGITGTQDAGEPFFSHGNSMGYDHYAYYITLRKLGPFKTIALGQYKLRFGLGLMMNTGFTFGKASALVMAPPTNSITPNTSRADAYYLQGAATTVALNRHTDITAFVSQRHIDATLNDDGSIKTLLRTGYHRTESEMARKHNASQTATGGNITWHAGGLHVGASGLFTTYSRELKPDAAQTFRRYYPTGKHFYNAAIDYGYINSRLCINGETAINDANAIATLNSIAFIASQQLTLRAIQRFYSYRYYSVFGSAFSDGGRVQNESGIYAGASWKPNGRLDIMAYCDYAYFPWARYRVSGASHSLDNFVQATYALGQQTSLTARYRLRLRQKDHGTNANGDKTLADKTDHRARLALAFAGRKWSARTSVDAAYSLLAGNNDDSEGSFGWMVAQTVGYAHKWLSATVGANYFRTHDYDSRLYAYERNTLYSFSFPMLYGRGMRMWLFLRGNIASNLSVTCKAAMTKYFDRDHISSSYQQIDGSTQTDIDLQIRWKF